MHTTTRRSVHAANKKAQPSKAAPQAQPTEQPNAWQRARAKLNTPEAKAHAHTALGVGLISAVAIGAWELGHRLLQPA